MNTETISKTSEFVMHFIELGALFFIFLLGLGCLLLVYIYLADKTQKRQAIRRNYPVIGRLRYVFEHLGEFFRQYFFAHDREELPFNRAQRTWVYRAAKNLDSTIAFGSSRPLNRPGDVVFLNDFFPVHKEHALPPSELCFGEGFAEQPYVTRSVFNISGMSFGALSEPAVRALSIGAGQAGIWMNTGEGGLSPFHLTGNCDLVFQIGTAKYGVRDEEGNLSDEKLIALAQLEQVKMFEIKMSQGAKPGKGGILPGAKVTPLIAEIRGIKPGEDSISPNGHKEIQSVEDVLNMIVHIRRLTRKPVGFKCVIGTSRWLDDMLQLIHQLGSHYAPDFITIDSSDGGTGAAPQSLMDAMGLPLSRSLPLVIDKLTEYGLRQRIKVIASGKLINPVDVAWALAMGADAVTSARGFLFSLGCIQALQCNKNTCPTGITTQNLDLQKGLDVANKSDRVTQYAKNMVKEVGILANSCGVPEPRKLRREHLNIIDAQGIAQPLIQDFPGEVGKPVEATNLPLALNPVHTLEGNV